MLFTILRYGINNSEGNSRGIVLLILFSSSRFTVLGDIAKSFEEYLCLGDESIFLRDGILEHQFNRRFEYFAPCYSQFFLLEDFKGNLTLLWFSKSFLKSLRKKKLYSIHE
jgi:hypothetical protein